MKIDLKKALLTGTAFVAVTAFAAQAHATGAQTLTGPTSWGSAGQPPAGTDGTSPSAGDAVDLVTFALTVKNDNTDNDGSADKNTFGLGAVTNTTGALTITTAATGTGDLTVTGTTVNLLTGTGSLTVTNNDGDNLNNSATFSGAVTLGGDLSVVNQEATDDVNVALTVGGNLAVTGAVAVTGSAGAAGGANATLDLKGTTINLGTGATLTDGGSAATLSLSGTGAQGVTGDIEGGLAGNGTVTVTNFSAGGVTFNGEVGGTTTLNTIVLDDTGGDIITTFKDNVGTANGLVIGTGNAGTVTATFDTTGGNMAVGGVVNGNAGSTSDIVISGGNTLTTNAAWGGGGNTIASVSLTGSDTTLTLGASLNATGVHVGTGTTVGVGAGTLTAPVSLTGTGTLLMSGGAVTGNVDGNADGAGTLSVTTSGTLTGNIGTAFSLSAINIAAGQTLTATGDVKATTTTLSGLGTGTLALGALAHNVTTNVVTGTDGAGAITVAGGATTTAITGNIGTSSAKLATFGVAGNAGNTVTTTGNLYVGAFTEGATDTLQFLGTSAQTVSGTIDTGIVTVGSGTTTSDVTFDGILGGGTPLAAMTVSANATAHLDADTSVTGAFTNTGTAYFAPDTVLTAGSVPTNTGTFDFIIKDHNGNGILDATDIGTISSAGVVDLSTSKINFDFSGPIVTGTLASWATSSGAIIAGATVTDDSYLYNVTPVLNGNNVDLTVSQAHTIASVATTSGNLNVGTVLQELEAVPTTNTQLLEIISNLNNAPSATAVNNVLESAQPTVDGGAVVAAADVTDQSLDLADQRLASLRSGEETGMAAGNSPYGMKVWGQAFGQHANQDERDSIAGYDSNTWGGAAGMDTGDSLENAVVGVGLSYARTNVDSKNANSTSTDIDSYQLTLYGDQRINPTMFVNGMIAYAWDKNATTRDDVGGVAGLDANGSYNAGQVAVRTELGNDFVYEGTLLTPTVLADYMHYDSGSYTETGAGGADLSVNSKSLDALNLGVGVKAGWKFKNPDSSVTTPDLHAGYRYAVIDDRIDSTSTFTGGGPSFTTSGFAPERSSFDVGADLKYYNADNWTLSASYDFTARTDYTAHAGLVRAAYKF